ERIALEPGVKVSPDSVVARIRPIASRPLDPRSRAEALAGVVAARGAVARAEATVREAEVSVRHVESKLARTRNLAESGSVPQADLEHGGHEVEISRQSLESARAAAGEAQADLARASAVVAPASRTDGERALIVGSPIRGRVLRVLREGAGPVAAGAPLLEIGDIARIEIVADLLWSDAGSVRADAWAAVTGWGGPAALSARVRRVDPAGFTKVSALGLEEQRVHVTLDLTEPLPPGLGHDYRVDVAIVVWESRDVLRVPSTALFRDGSRWATFVIRDGRARLQAVETGPSDAAWTVVRRGLAHGEKVIPQPSDTIRDGMRVDVLREVPSGQ
ncbi:MAG TPA: HlyD family efflux transporter periplasmic adaptor subunit, partial [Polyangiaceae bacterium]|nr:HlyD family efflux transporter periplasmic adaptor subunit [Polyangiaceae bacterium]